MTNVQHSCANVRWGTPKTITDRVLKVLGKVDIDPCSEPGWNPTNASQVLTDGLNNPWYGKAFVNPPGKLKKQFWNKLVDHWSAKDVTAAIYIAYSIEELQTSQVGTKFSLLDFPICYPDRRVSYVNIDTGLGMTKPTHASAIVLVADPYGLDAKFWQSFHSYGKVVIPERDNYGLW